MHVSVLHCVAPHVLLSVRDDGIKVMSI